MDVLTSLAIVIVVIAVVVMVHRRSRHPPGERSPSEPEYVTVELMGNLRDGTGPDTYRAAYELITRGIDVRLEMQELWRERPRMWVSFFLVGGESHVTSRTVYRTDLFAPYLDSIKTIADFQR